MHRFRYLYPWIGVSSNNIFWNATDIPIRVIQVPKPKEYGYVTVINPEIKLDGDSIENIEACGSIPHGECFTVLRYPYVLLSGANILGKLIELKYGYKRKKCYSIRKQGIVQHEYDHIEGILLLDRSI